MRNKNSVFVAVIVLLCLFLETERRADGQGYIQKATTATTPGGSSGQVQYNNSNAFGGMSGTSWDDAGRDFILTSVLGDDMVVFSGNHNTGDANYGSLFSAVGSVAAPDAVGTSLGTVGPYIQLQTVTGGDTTIPTTGIGGDGGDLFLFAALGGSASYATTAATGGNGGKVRIGTGIGKSVDDSANVGINVGGNGGGLYLSTGDGGRALHGSYNAGGNGGSMLIKLGNGGTGADSNGLDGTFRLYSGALFNAPIMKIQNNSGGADFFVFERDNFRIVGTTYANRPATPANGMRGYFTDGAITSAIDDTCTGSGSGANAYYTNGAWKCVI